MNTKTTLSITEARKKIFKIAKDIQKPSRYYTLTERGRPKVVLMSAEEFESWQETLEVMREFPDLDKDIAEVDRAVKSGEYKNWTTLEELLKEYGYILADKGKNKYNVSIKNRAKGKKATRKNSKNLSR
ncbi:type II toxin-antitoxin system Phd/YefM family antitoxin [Patescibacteria group bacterium]|nr:type II toxin-antitoxin system Phd/YefM family antitoxin [Patescibacteria group bacterium]